MMFGVMYVIDYRRVAGDASDAVGDERNQIGDGSAEIVVPRTLSLFLVQIVQRRSLPCASISRALRASNAATWYAWIN